MEHSQYKVLEELHLQEMARLREELFAERQVSFRLRTLLNSCANHVRYAGAKNLYTAITTELAKEDAQ